MNITTQYWVIKVLANFFWGMEQNNFKLFEIANETILDIYDFVLRYFATLGLSIFRPKLFLEIVSTDSPFKRIVRPYNFILFSFILLVLGIELVKEPLINQEQQVLETLVTEQQEKFDEREYQLNQKKDEPTEVTEKAQLLDQILGLDTKSLIKRFLPALLIFILISKIIEKVLCKAFQEDTEYGYVYIYGIGSSCSVFAIILMLIYAGDYYTLMESASFEFFAGFIISIFSISFTMIVFPAFLIARALKAHQIKFLRRSFVFVILTFFNFVISSAYVYVLIPEEEPTSASTFEEEIDENILFDLQSVNKTDDGIILSISHSYPSAYTFNQNTHSWINAVNFLEEPTVGLFSSMASFSNKGRSDESIRLKSFIDYELNLSVYDSLELAVFDSLYAINDYFIIELQLIDEEGLFKNGIIEINNPDSDLNDINFSD